MSRFSLAFLAGLSFTALAHAGDATLKERLDGLAETLEAARVESHVPGMSIAIVKDDEVVWARGFGLADVAGERAADEETIYAIGSTTKAFTATLIGMLADEDRIAWDDPVTKYLPYFDLQVRSDDEDAECTLRDLLSHRHGFSRMGILWFGGEVSREEILRTAAGAEPWDDFRQAFHYCNVTYLGAGEAAGVAAETTWDELMVERLFKPLGMTSSTLSVTDAQEDPRLALGYGWNDAEERFDHRRMAVIDNVGPAGSVNSNVVDMAQWVRFQLARGAFEGERLISEENLRETWTSQISIGSGVDYGLGWMLREHAGRQVVEHGGGINGFTAQVSLMPEENLGYVLLMNRDGAALRQSSLGLIFDALIEDEPVEESSAVASGEAPDPGDLDDYVGVYVANFATFRDEEFRVLVQEDGLALDVPSQQVYALKEPNADGRWMFALTDTIAVSFQRDAQGAVVTLTMHQGGFDFEVPRKGHTPEPEVPLEELESLVGTYVRQVGGKRVQFFLRDNRLFMEDKGKQLPFFPPDADGRAVMRANASFYATFKKDAEGQAESFVFHGTSGDRLFTRLAEAADDNLPTVEDVLALRRTEARIASLREAGGVKSSGTVWIAQAGVRGTVTVYTQGDDRFATHLDFGKFGRIDLAVREGKAWRYNSLQGFDELSGEQLGQALLEHPAAVEGDWREYFDEVEVTRNDTVNDRPTHVVRLKKGDLPSRTYWVDAENGDVLRAKHVTLESGARLPVTIDYSGFEEHAGIRRASRAEVENPESGRTVLTFETSESGLELGDEHFTLEDPELK